MVTLSLRTKTTLLAVALVVASFALIGIVQQRQLARGVRVVLQNQQDALAEAVANDLSDKIETHLAVLEQTAAGLDAATIADPLSRNAFLARSGARPLFDGIGIALPDGEMLPSETLPAGAPRMHIGDRDYFRRLVATRRPAVSSPVQIRTGRGAGVLMVAPAHDAQGRLIGVVAGSLLLQRSNMLGQLARAPVGRTGHFEIVTRGPAPVYVVHPDPARLLQPAAVPAAGSVGEGDVVSRKTMRSVDWELRVVLPAWEALAPVQEAQRRLAWELAGLAAGTALLVWLGMVWLLRPLATLHDHVRTLRRQPDAPLNLDTGSDDERGRLAREFEALMKTLRGRQAELVAVTEASPLGFFKADADGELTYVNEAYLRLHGLGREQTARGWLQLVREDIRDDVWRAWQDIVRRGEAFQTVRRIERPDGREALLSIRSSPLVVDGRIEGLVGTVTDITERAAAEKAMRVLTAIFDSTTDYVVQTDGQGRISYMNPAARRVLQIDADAAVDGLDFAQFMTPATIARFGHTILPAVKEHGVWLGDNTVYTAGRREIPVSHMVIAHRDKRGRIEHYSGVMRDISAQHRQTATLTSIAEAIPAVVAVVGADQRYRFVNAGFERWHGAARDRIVGRSMAEVLGAAEHERSRPWVERVLAGEKVQFEKSYPERADTRHLAVSYIPLWQADGTIDGFVAVAQDITRQRQEQDRLLALSRRDPLTGVLNRAGFEQHLQRAVGDGLGTGLAVLYIDLDHFKPVNDRHGHPAGDEVLRQFALRLKALVRPTDAVARLGGDEFALVLTGVREIANAEMVADKVIEAARTAFRFGALELHVAASVGVAFGVAPHEDWRALVARADALLYRAKAGGRGRHAIALH